MVATLVQQGQEFVLKQLLHKVQMANEVQTISITGTPTGGTFKLSFEDDVTVNINWDANAAAVQSALEALASITSGEISITGTNPNFTATFQGFLAGTPCPLIGLDTNALTGGTTPSVAIAETTPGAGGIPQYYWVGLSQSLRATLTEAVTLSSINEVTGTGYARVRVRADSTDFVAALVSSYWQAVTKTCTFTAGGTWSVAKSLFIATTKNNDGKVLDVRDLASEFTLASGQSRSFNLTEMFAAAA